MVAAAPSGGPEAYYESGSQDGSRFQIFPLSIFNNFFVQAGFQIFLLSLFNNFFVQAGRLLREPEPPGEPEEVRGGDSDLARGQPRPQLPVRLQQAAEGFAKVHGQPHVHKVGWNISSN